MDVKRKNTAIVAVIGIVAVMLGLTLSTIWMGQRARGDSERAVRQVSLFYLEELTGSREQVVADNLQDRIRDMQSALGLLTDDDLSDMEHLQAYQSQMKQLFALEKFAFVDADGLIYTSQGTQTDIDSYHIDYRTLDGPDISIKDLNTPDKKVIIAVPLDGIPFNGEQLMVCFMEINMQEMLSRVSIQSQTNGATFCNLYTSDGIALSNTVLGGLSVEDNLLTAMQHAVYEDGYSYEDMARDFAEGMSGEVCFTYNGIQETLSYRPVDGTNWMLTYLIRESVISDHIGSVSSGILRRSIWQSMLTVAVLLGIFSYVIAQNRRNARLILAKETSDAENRVKQQELEQRLRLQEKLLEEERQSEQQDRLITALASDYRGVYYVNLESDECICYQKHQDLVKGYGAGEHFRYLESMTAYARDYVLPQYRDEFLRFIQPESILEGLRHNPVISCTYMVHRRERDQFEMLRFSGVRRPEDRDEEEIYTVGAGFTDVDTETRKSLSQQQALSDALTAAEEANKAKTAFLSNMSHEIRTPMNAIIGLDSIALNDPETPEKTKEYLVKIGSSAEHLLGLINDILDMSRIESGRMTLKNEDFSFRKLLEAINTMFSSQCSDKGLEYQCRINGQIDDYYIGDDMKLRQILINILGNAVKFTPEGGSVTLQVERLARFDRQTTLQFKVTDTGIGMSPEFLPRIFDTFSQEDSSSTNKYGSSGLGMSITKSIVEMMNGNISVESEKGRGSTFTVTVTLLDSARKDTGSSRDEFRPEEMSVLIIDDDTIACEHAKLVLEKAGIASETALSGAEALEMVRLRHARREPYNLILVDWKMPEMDGVETSRRIRQIVGKQSAIIILTAYRWDDIMEEALEAGVDSFLPKPLFAASVVEAYQSAADRKALLSGGQTAPADLAGRRVLLAEDVEINAEIMMMVLQSRGMEADLAVNGRIAVEKFAGHPEGYYAAILMDMRMPEMDGLEATRTIRAMDRADAASIPIIALTANAFDEDVQRSMQAGLNAHLSKPVQPEVLFGTLESLIQ